MQTRLLAAVVALLLVLSGCGALPSGQPPSDERAVDERERVASALDSVSTYRFTVDGTVSASDGDRTRTVDVSGEGVVNKRRQRMRSNATADGTTRSRYLDGYTSYTECPEWDGWGVDNASESTAWFDLTPLGRQMALVRESTVYWGGNETLDGTRTFVLVAHPSKETLTSLPDIGRTTQTDLSRANIENATVRLWVDSETARPVKSDLHIDLSTGGASGTVDVTVRYHSYDEPVTVSLPASTRTDRYELGCPG